MMILKPGKTYTSPSGRTGSDFVARIDGFNFDRFNNNQVTIYVSIYENGEAQVNKRPSFPAIQQVVFLPDLIQFSQALDLPPITTPTGIFENLASICYLYLHTLPQWENWQSDQP